MEYSVFICDDNLESIDYITEIVQKAAIILSSDDDNIKFNIHTAREYVEATNYLTSNPKIGGIYFLDIELGEEKHHNSGFDLASLIKKQDQKAQIIFVTSHSDLSIITYQRRLGPVDYIVKPDSEVKEKDFRIRVVQTLNLAIQNIEQFDYIEKMTFSYHVGRIVRNVNIDNIIYIMTTPIPHKLIMKKKTGEAQFLGSLSQYAAVNPRLKLISQSCLVNPKNIVSIDLKKHQVLFINGDIKEFSRKNTRKIHDLLSSYNYEIENLNYKNKANE